MVKAYILVEIEAGQSDQVVANLRDIPGVVMADPITGPYDIIAVVEVEDSNVLGSLIRTKLQQVGGVKRTVTCLSIG